MTDLKEIYEQELKIANTNASLYDGEYFENLVIEKFKGNICRNQTSCTDQLARALEELQEKKQ